MTNRARTEYDTAFSSQLPNNISAPSIDIPQFHGSNNFQGNDFGGSKEGSTHTTPLNYMTRSTPSSSIRKVEQIREIDPYHGGEIGDDFEIDRRFNTMNLSSGASDDFFQLQNGNNDALQELEPIEQNRAVKGQDVPLQPPNNHNWTGNDQTLISEKGDNPRYRDILSGNSYENNYQQGLSRNTHNEISLNQHQTQSQQTSRISSGGYLIMEPSGYGQQTEGDGSLGYKPQINSASSSHSSSSSSSSYNLATPRESWAPAGHQQHQHMQQQNAPPAHLPYQQHIQQQQMYAPNNRRSNPATPSLLSSYATANAQPSLAPAVLQNRLVRGGPVVSQPQLMEYGQNQYRTVEDYGRPAHQDRVPYGGRGGPGGSNGGYYPPAPVAAAAAPRSQYGHGGQPLAAYGQQQLGGHPHDSIMHNYYADNSPASQQLPPVQPDFIFQVQFKRTSKSFTNRSGLQIVERDFVVVEGDRGEDIGVVIEVMSMQEFMHRRMHEYRVSSDKDNHSVDCILRLATMHERQQLPDKFQAEKNIIQSCNELAMYGFGLPIMVYDAEFQFDRNKLTIYYECNVRIDFRDFVRQLYSTYKARIWMKIGNINTPLEVQPLAAMALATGVQFSTGNAAC